ncbi:hypothetical protein P7C71_g4419, partial [Lecanoromycetidae sp. Uapishka_2]
MPLFNIRPRALPQSGSLLRAGFATSKPRTRAQAPGPRRSVRRPPPPKPPPKRPSYQPQSSHRPQDRPSEAPKELQSSVDSVSHALKNADADSNNLLSPVHVPEDPHGVLNEKHPATSILSNSAIVVTRQLELMNVMLGFEQANKYVIMDPHGNHIGFMAERELGMGNMMARQMFSTHRSFTTHVFDKHGKEVLRFHRPFSWISSRIGVYDPMVVGDHSYSSSTGLTTSVPGSLTTEVNPDQAQVSPLEMADMRIIGRAEQQWAPLRRKYNLFVHRRGLNTAAQAESRQPSPHQPLSNAQAMDLTPYNAEAQYDQFAFVDEPFLSWDFSLLASDSKLIGSVNRNFAGFGREIFTDTGVYALRMDSASIAQEPGHLISKTGQRAELLGPGGGMTLDQRAVMLATAVSVDFDYFSRKSGSGGGMMGYMPMWFPGMGGGAAETGAGAEAGAAGAEGGAVDGAGNAAGGVARGGASGAGEGAMTGAGTMAGYEAMQRGTGRSEDDASPQAGLPPADQDQQLPGQVGQDEDVWGTKDDDPWGGDGGDGGGDG